MELVANRTLLKHDPSAGDLVDLLEKNNDQLNLQESVLYYNFPLYRDNEEQANRLQLLLVSRNHGIIVHGCCTEDEKARGGANFDSPTEQSHSLIFSKLIKSRILRKNPTTLSIALNSCFYIAGQTGASPAGIPILGNFQQIRNFYRSVDGEPLSNEEYREAISIIEGSKAINKPADRIVNDATGPRTKGKILITVEREIAVFDAEQKRAALNILDGPQRIRGLAGSGKTIILTMKAAQIHLQHPEVQILYTFYTKSLYDLIKVLITRFYRAFSDNDPDWSKIDIMHAWGGQALPGVYSSTAAAHNLKAMTLGELRQYPDPFNFACGDLILNDLKRSYDFTLLDEAQDFPVNFYRLCEQITKERRIIWGYDECQNILNIDLQDAKKTFGQKDGTDIIDFANSPDGQLSDIVLHVCYRNPRRVLIAAFSLGFGLYSGRIVQILENNDHWNDLGFKVVKGSSQPGDKMVIERPEENSPLVGVRLLEDSESVQMHVLDGLDTESAFIAERIIADIASELLAEDILVIALDDRNARTYFDAISGILRKQGIKTFNLLQAPNNTKHFRVKDHVTLSTVYRAKGNEAASVYVLGVDAVFESRISIQHRNRLFTAITRAKAWVTLTGVGDDARACQKELVAAMANYPRLEFEMPDKGEIKVFQRDLEEGQAKMNEMEREITLMAKKHGLDPQELFQRLSKKPKAKK